jgi:hypothetical protein
VGHRRNAVRGASWFAISIIRTRFACLFEVARHNGNFKFSSLMVQRASCIEAAAFSKWKDDCNCVREVNARVVEQWDTNGAIVDGI